MPCRTLTRRPFDAHASKGTLRQGVVFPALPCPALPRLALPGPNLALTRKPFDAFAPKGVLRQGVVPCLAMPSRAKPCLATLRHTTPRLAKP